MEDGKYLSAEDKSKLAALQEELSKLKEQHKKFAKNKGGLSSDEREEWRLNSQRTNQVYIEIKDLRLKNVLEAGK
jgi:hypothetical protein